MGQPAIEVVPLFPGLRVALIELLRDLTREEWNRPMLCDDWTVRDIARHLMGADVNFLFGDCNGPHKAPTPALDPSRLADIVPFIDRRNAVSLDAMGWPGPQLTREFLAEIGPQVQACFRLVDLVALGRPVAQTRRRSGSTSPASTPSTGSISGTSAKRLVDRERQS